MFSRQGIPERRDGATIVDWAAQLPGSNNRVGMIGLSYDGNLAIGAAAFVKPGSPLKAISVGGAGLDGFPREIFMRGGAITRTGNAILGACNGYGRTGSDPTVTYCQTLQDEIFAGGPAAFLGDYWNERGNLEDARKIVDNGVAALVHSNWQDITQTAAINAFTAMLTIEAAKPRANKDVYDTMDPNLPSRARYQLIIGEGGHSQTDQNIHMAWLDTFVRGQDTGIDKVANPVHMRERTRWINARTWPLTYDYTPLYLNASGALTTTLATPVGPAGTLAFNTFANESGGTLAFTTAPFADGATVGGAMAATIYASTNGTNLQLMATMYSVAPDGTQTFMQDGVLVGSQRTVDEAKSWRDANGVMYRPLHTHTHDAFLEPNVPYRFEIFIQPRLWPVPPGHSLRLALSSRPTQAICPTNAGGLNSAPCHNTDPQEPMLAGTTTTILADPTYPSSVNLPLLPYGHFPTATTETLPRDWGPEYRMACVDLTDARMVMGSRSTETRFLPRADLDRNGVIDIRDIAAIARQVPAGTACR